MTERLFDKDSYIKEFSARCISSTKENEVYKIALDKTAFFPEGGGQKGDTGFLNGIEVFDTQEEDGIIYHYTYSPIEENALVEGRLNWDERFFKMQNHTAEHMISGLVFKKFGYSNTGFHLGTDFVTMDYNGPISERELDEIEYTANRLASEGRSVTAYYPDPDDLLHLIYRSKLDLKENVRIVDIKGIDSCACCAPHVKNTAEVGMIKIISCQRYKGGVRILAKSGMYAFRELNTYQKTLKNISALLSLPPEETDKGVEKLLKRLEEQRYCLNGLKAEKLKTELNDSPLPYAFVDSPELLKDAVNILFEKHGGTCGAFSGDDETGYRFMILSDLDNIKDLLRESLNASGGGRDNMLQGMIRATREKIANFFDKVLTIH